MKNNAEQYFKQKDFTVIELLLLALAIISGIVATFVDGGIPMGLPVLLVAVIGFYICRSLKIKDAVIDEILEKIIKENQIELSDQTMVGFDLKDTIVKKRKDGKIISPKYYITNVSFVSPEETVFSVCRIDIITSSVKKDLHTVRSDDEIVVVEETINTPFGHKTLKHLKIGSSDNLIPITLSDYKSSEFIEQICNRNEKK